MKVHCFFADTMHCLGGNTTETKPMTKRNAGMGWTPAHGIHSLTSCVRFPGSSQQLERVEMAISTPSSSPSSSSHMHPRPNRSGHNTTQHSTTQHNRTRRIWSQASTCASASTLAPSKYSDAYPYARRGSEWGRDGMGGACVVSE
jgi:hypothetical protein